MRLVKISAFTKLTQDALASYATNVVTLMTENSLFAPLSTSVAAVKQDNTAYIEALAANVLGGILATRAKDDCKKTLIEQMTLLALSVDIFAKGDAAIVIAAGFDTHNTGKPITYINPPPALTAINKLTTGVVNLKWTKSVGAKNYGIEKRPKATNNTENAWQNGEYTRAVKIELTGLMANTIYEFRYRAICGEVVSDWSPVTELMVT